MTSPGCIASFSVLISGFQHLLFFFSIWGVISIICGSITNFAPWPLVSLFFYSLFQVGIVQLDNKVGMEVVAWTLTQMSIPNFDIPTVLFQLLYSLTHIHCCPHLRPLLLLLLSWNIITVCITSDTIIPLLAKSHLAPYRNASSFILSDARSHCSSHLLLLVNIGSTPTPPNIELKILVLPI